MEKYNSYYCFYIFEKVLKGRTIAIYIVIFLINFFAGRNENNMKRLYADIILNNDELKDRTWLVDMYNDLKEINEE